MRRPRQFSSAHLKGWEGRVKESGLGPSRFLDIETLVKERMDEPYPRF